jgi:hypothetical protein
MERIPTFAQVFEMICEHESLEKAPAGLREFAERIFFAGAGSALRAVDVVAKTAETPAMGIAALDALRSEVTAFQAKAVRELLHELLEEHGIDVEVRVIRMPE